jgi:hypothetical protein
VALFGCDLALCQGHMLAAEGIDRWLLLWRRAAGRMSEASAHHKIPCVGPLA